MVNRCITFDCFFNDNTIIMNNTQAHAKKELEILEKTVKDPIIAPFTKEILALCEAVGNSGQSGGSNPYTASAISQAIKKLLMFETLAPLTGEDSEWNRLSDGELGEEMLYQNNRDSRVFKGKDNKAYFIDAIIFDGDIGGGFHGGGIKLSNGDTVGSGQYIKEFPFTPKVFYIDVTDRRWKDKEENDEDPDGDWWTHTIKDEKQLEEVFKYYNKK